MAPKAVQWVSGREAANILTKNSGHEVSPDYVRLLSNQKKIRSRAVDRRTKEYHRADIEKYVVRKKTKEKEETIDTSSEIH